jgi:hypothetical protein
MGVDAESLAMLKEQHKCPYFHILVIGRANAGKTTILEKVCGVAEGTQPIIYDEHGVELKANIAPKLQSKPEPSHGPNIKARFKLPIKQLFNRKSSSVTHSIDTINRGELHGKTYGFPSIDMQPIQRGIHDIQHQITYPGSNFIFHDSKGFEAGASEEMEIVWKFIKRRSVAAELRDQLHAIWYLCFPSLYH